MLEMADLPSDPHFERFGSIEVSAVGVDECSEISQRAIEVLFSRIRWRVHETLGVSKMLMTTNPTTNWIRGRFVQDDDGNKVIPREGEYYVPFSVFDNPDIAFRQTYEAALNKISDQATKERLLYGNWDYVEANDMAIYNRFDGSRHLVPNLKEQVYDPSKPLITVWDFNVAPQMSVLTAQIDYDRKRVYILEEILGKPETKENNTPALSLQAAGQVIPRQARRRRRRYGRPFGPAALDDQRGGDQQLYADPRHAGRRRAAAQTETSEETAAAGYALRLRESGLRRIQRLGNTHRPALPQAYRGPDLPAAQRRRHQGQEKGRGQQDGREIREVRTPVRLPRLFAVLLSAGQLVPLQERRGQRRRDLVDRRAA